MSRFAGVLQRVSDGLELPQAAKSRILLEVAGDLEDLYRHYRAQGETEAEATARAEEAFAVSDEALRHLARVHAEGVRFTDRLSRQAGTWWEKLLLVVWAVTVLLLVARVAGEERFFLIVSPFFWPLVGLAAVAFALSLWKLYELVGRGAPDAGRLRSGLGVLLFISGASLAVSSCGFLYHLRWYAFHSYEGGAERVFQMFGTWTMVVSSMMIVGLSTAVLAALVWFLLANLVARIERREADALLAG